MAGLFAGAMEMLEMAGLFRTFCGNAGNGEGFCGACPVEAFRQRWNIPAAFRLVPWYSGCVPGQKGLVIRTFRQNGGFLSTA